MPATLKIDFIICFVGRIEVNRQTNPKHSNKPDGHVGVTLKIEIELEGVGKSPSPSFNKA
jgi:hypothetical protein